MAVVSLCFSGNPRTILSYREEWREYFEMIAREHELRILFHCWSETGLVAKRDGTFVEGTYHSGQYDCFDTLIAFLRPAAFRIEAPVYDYHDVIEDLGEIYVSHVQAPPRAILSQIHSIHQANEIRQRYDSLHGRSDVVVRLRFDLRPTSLLMREIDYVIAHPSYRVLFAPHPHWHGHPGGGGGCMECHGFFDRERLGAMYPEVEARFLATHPHHHNDICDLYAIGSPETMDIYSNSFPAAASAYQKIKERFSEHMDDYVLEEDRQNSRIKRIVSTRSGHFDMERSPIFVPEKIIRQNMAGTVIVHAESMFVYERR